MREWTIIDIESTGITNPIYMIEFYAQKMRGLEPHGDPLHIFINHNVLIPPEATAIHGYTNEFIAQNGINPWKAHKEIERYLDKHPVCSHNLAYDWERCLVPERRRLKVPFVGSRGFCTVALFRRCLPITKNFKLERLREHYGIENKSHSAKGDVLTVIEILNKYAIPKLNEIGVNTFDEIKNFSRRNPVGECRQLLGLEPLLNTKPTPDDVLSVLAQAPTNQELKEKDLEIIDSWVGDNIHSLGINKISPRIERTLDTGFISQNTKEEILELIQPLLPINEPKGESINNVLPSTDKTTPRMDKTKEPASLRQINYLKVLGHSDFNPDRLTKKEASDLIDKIKYEKNKTKATDIAMAKKPALSRPQRSIARISRRKRQPISKATSSFKELPPM